LAAGFGAAFVAARAGLVAFFGAGFFFVGRAERLVFVMARRL
jgi:hypothetical protein